MVGYIVIGYPSVAYLFQEQNHIVTGSLELEESIITR